MKIITPSGFQCLVSPSSSFEAISRPVERTRKNIQHRCWSTLGLFLPLKMYLSLAKRQHANPTLSLPKALQSCWCWLAFCTPRILTSHMSLAIFPLTAGSYNETECFQMPLHIFHHNSELLSTSSSGFQILLLFTTEEWISNY